MEPLTALSVANSVVQFVEFGGKLLSNTRTLYHSVNGVLSENVDIDLIASDIQNLLLGLKRKLPENRPLSSSATKPGVNETDESLDRICRKCVAIAEELLRKLDTLKMDPETKSRKLSSRLDLIDKRETQTTAVTLSATRPPAIKQSQIIQQFDDGKTDSLVQDENTNSLPRIQKSRIKSILVKHGHNGSTMDERAKDRLFRGWAAFRKALEAIWNKQEIEALAATLKEFRDEIEFHMLVSFREALNDLAVQQTNTSHLLSQSTSLILDAFLKTRDDFAANLQEQAEGLIGILAPHVGKEAGDCQRVEDFLKGKLDPVGTLRFPKGAEDERHRNSVTSKKEKELEQELCRLMAENEILNSLSFPTIADRRQNLEDPFQRTFEWIFDGSCFATGHWSSFPDWLLHGSGIYWINGKLGSGKSTLMRFICSHGETMRQLELWATPLQPRVLGFFFWNSGCEDQRSQSGLFRSLLFELLQGNRELLPELLPRRWEVWYARAEGLVCSKLPLDSPLLPPEPKSWDMAELRETFQRVLKSLERQTRMAIFIDGLDEYEGDYIDIVDSFQEYSKSSNLKICISSRPIEALERAFATTPTLKLQELSQGDIRHYVQSSLQNHRHVTRLGQYKKEEMSLLVHEVVDKARGVFLWVKLVVRSLLEGLSDSNRISVLRKRVEQLPEDLEDLYTHMFSQANQLYQERAARIFQIVHVAQQQPTEILTLLNLSWAVCADDEDETPVERLQFQRLDCEEISSRCQMLDAELRTVCSGLLESTDLRFSDIQPDAKVMFLHRTVSDWLSKTSVWNKLVSITKDSNFSPSLSMFIACVARLKTMEFSTLDLTLLHNALNYATQAETDLGYGFPHLLDQLDYAASYQLREFHAHNGSRQRVKLEQPSFRSISSKNSYTDEATAVGEAKLNKSPHIGLAQLSSHKIRSSLATTLAAENAIVGSGTDEMHHWSYMIDIPDINPAGRANSLFDLARNIGLTHFVAMKEKSGVIMDQDIGLHLIFQAIPSNGMAPNPYEIEQILNGGINPNLSYQGTTPWKRTLESAVGHFVSENDSDMPGTNWLETAMVWAEAIRVFIEHGADTNAHTDRLATVPNRPRLTVVDICNTYYPRFSTSEAAKLKQLLPSEEVGFPEASGLLVQDDATTNHDESKSVGEIERQGSRMQAILSMVSWLRFI